MRIMEWWQQAGATSAWLPAVARAGLVAEVGQSIDALDPELRELTSALLLCQKSDHLQALAQLDSPPLYDRFNGFISLIKARIFAELGDFANVIRELQNAERLHVDEQMLAEVSDLLLSRDVNSHGEPIQGPGRCQCEEWERALGEFINCLPRDIQSHIHNRTPAFVWLTDDSIVAMFAITLDMKQAEYASALQLIEDNYSGSRSKGHLFLLRARILAALEEFDEMFLCLQGAAELCDDTEMFQLVFDELSTTVMDQLKAKQTNDAHIGLDSNLDERPKNMDWNEGDQPRWVATPGDESNLQAALKSARDKQQNCEYADAIHEYQRALALCPDIDYVKGNLAFCMANACVWDGLEALMKEIETEAKSGARVIDPFCAALLLDDPKLLRQVAEAFSNGCFPESPNALWRGENYHHSRTRVAYLSADYHGHATAYLIAELLESHNKDKFETYGISYGKDVNDSMRSRLSKAFDHFIDVTGKNDREVAELMRAMEIDIAIDLKGFTPNSRPGILANRPCPVQAQYLGFPGTMGSPFIDYVIADYVIIPESHEPYFSEKVLRFTGTYQPTTDGSNRSEHKLITRSDEGLPSDGFVYCCFNNNYKITPEIFDVWMNILRETPGSVLWLLEGNEDAPENLRFEALKRGIEPERLIFAAKKSVEDHLARHQLADLFLDTAPCNAHTTASDALNAGLPVLTIMGDTFASRVAASVGQSFDSGLTVARDLDEYTQIAVQQQPSSVAEKRSVAATMAEELEKMFQGALEDAIERASDKGSCSTLNNQVSARRESDLGNIRNELNGGIGTLNRSAIEALESYPAINYLVDQAKSCANQILTVDIDSQMERRNPTFHSHTNVLFNIAVAYCQPEDVILEIGVWRGHTPAVIHFIDPTLKYIGIDPLELVGQAEDVKSLISKLGENYVVEPEYSSECAFKLLHLKGSVQIIHIDGAHDRRNVFNDFMLYRDLLKPNGILIFDDYLDFKHSPQVKPIIDDLKRYDYFSDFIEIGVTNTRSNYILVKR